MAHDGHNAPIALTLPAAHRVLLVPRHEQALMGGRIPVTHTESTIPEALNQVLVGPITAAEIGWHKE